MSALLLAHLIAVGAGAGCLMAEILAALAKDKKA